MESKYELEISPQAAQDFENIFSYISKELCNPTAAVNLMDDFENALESVCNLPFSCPIVNNEFVKDSTLRKLIVNNYIAFYKIDETEGVIIVVRVLYGMMNLKDIL